MINDKYFMDLAITLAKGTLGQTSPNPAVGAVLVKNNQILGYGAHLQAGGMHAEIMAMKQALGDLKDATLYVTLEPCHHFGKTPPCTDAIIASKIKKVVIATLDENPNICGGGIQKLQQAGIIVEVGVCEKEAKELNSKFFYYIKHNLPYVSLKCGMSLDAKLATSIGESKWITNESARLDGHMYRHTHDAILVGVNTIINDNPQLNTRLENGLGNNPLRIILDTSLRTPKDSQVIVDRVSKTLIVVGSLVENKKISEYQNLGIEILQVETPKIELKKLLQILAKKHITSILVEGGSTIHNKFIEEKLFNQLILYISPLLIGGESTKAFFSGIGFEHLKDAINLDYEKLELMDGNLKLVLKPNNFV